MNQVIKKITKILCPILTCGVLFAQDYRATITGVVKDSSDAVVSGATVTVHDLDTNEDLVVTSNGKGVYRTPFLSPAQHYQITATANGFKTNVLEPLLLSVGQIATADVVMQIGGNEEVVNVSATDPLLDAQNADIGTVIDNKTISEMPTPSRSVFSLVPLAAGVNNQKNGDGTQSYNPDTYANSTRFSVNGGSLSTANATVDGMSLLADVNGTLSVGMIPILDSVQEFKMVTSGYDASYGHSSSTMSLVSKSGTTEYHGALWEYVRQTFMDANTYLANSTGTKRTSLSMNQFGGELDGPLYIPKIYTKRDRTFFTFAYEHYTRHYPNFQTYDVPDPQWLKGDFSNLVDINGNQIPIYDPSSSISPSGSRTQFGNGTNIIPQSQLDPVALKILSYFPPTNIKLPGSLPYEQSYAVTAPATAPLEHYIVKVEHQLNSEDRVFAEYLHNHSLYNAPKGVLGIGAAGDLPESNTANDIGADWVHSFSNNLLLNVHANFLRYDYTADITVNDGFDLSSLGLPTNLQSQLTTSPEFPEVNIGTGYLQLGGPNTRNVSNTYNIDPNITWIRGKHTLRSGIDIIYSQYAPYTNSSGGITLAADTIPTQTAYNNAGTNPTMFKSKTSGNSVASFLVGVPSTKSTVFVSAFPFYSFHYFAPWVQDDWKITPRLTLNLGFRWDLQAPPTERHNAISNGFDPSVASPLQGQINTSAYSGILRGGLTFAGVDGGSRAPYNLDTTDAQARVGFAYRLYPNVVLRGGYGRYYVNTVVTNLPFNPGYSYTASVVNSVDGGITNLPHVLDNPFPNGIAPAVGNSAGLASSAGLAVTYYDRNFKMPHSDLLSLGLEQQVGHNGVLSLNYVGSRAVQASNIDVNENRSLYASCDYTNNGDESKCQQLVSNPFYGLSSVDPSLSTGTQIAAYKLAVPYPQFSSVKEYGQLLSHSWYNAMQLSYRVQTHDIDINAAETWSKLMDRGGFTDAIYQTPARTVDPLDVTHRVTVSALWQFPIGRGEKFLGNISRWEDMVIGGWKLGTIYTFHTGAPQSISSSSTVNFIAVGPVRGGGLQKRGPQIINSDMNPCVATWTITNKTTGQGRWDLTSGSTALGCTTASWHQQVGYQPDTSQGVTDQVRQPGFYQFDANIAKTFSLVGRLHFQLRLDAFNVFNNPTYNLSYSLNTSNGEFGTIDRGNTGQANLPREAQVSGRFTW